MSVQKFDEWWQQTGINHFGPSQPHYLLAREAWNAAIDSAAGCVEPTEEQRRRRVLPSNVLDAFKDIAAMLRKELKSGV